MHSLDRIFLPKVDQLLKFEKSIFRKRSSGRSAYIFAAGSEAIAVS